MTMPSNEPSNEPSIATAFDHEPVAVQVPRDVIRASGPDTEAFLQGQLSQDIAPLAPGESAWALLLQPQGKVDAWLRITRIDATSFLLDLDAGAAEATLTRLNRFKLRTACDLETESWSTVSIRGPGAHDVEIAAASGAEVVVPAGWPGVEGIDALGASVALPDELTVASLDDLELLRVACGVPAMGAELTESTIPAEAGVVERSVSFTKGCYTGQELVARIDSRGGNVPRRLRGLLAADAAALAVGQAVESGGVDVGIVTSKSGPVALAYIRRSIEQFPASATVDGRPVQLYELPMYRQPPA